MEKHTNTMISTRLPEFTLDQMKQIQKFYELDLGDKFSRSRIIIICVNYFWKHIFEEKHELSGVAEKALELTK